jgi:hypothetical protein
VKSPRRPTHQRLDDALRAAAYGRSAFTYGEPTTELRGTLVRTLAAVRGGADGDKGRTTCAPCGFALATPLLPELQQHVERSAFAAEQVSVNASCSGRTRRPRKAYARSTHLHLSRAMRPDSIDEAA